MDFEKLKDMDISLRVSHKDTGSDFSLSKSRKDIRMTIKDELFTGINTELSIAQPAKERNIENIIDSNEKIKLILAKSIDGDELGAKRIYDTLDDEEREQLALVQDYLS